MEGAFYYCYNLTFNATDSPDLSNVTDMSYMFGAARSFNSDISSWDVSNVENMSYLFYYAIAFNQDISSWDVSNVTNMSTMFSNARAFNQDIGKWTTTSLTNAENMFYYARSFNQNINNWDVSNVTNMSRMFNYATSFNQDIDNWNVSNVTSMTFMFFGASSFNKNISNWNLSKLTNMSYMFKNATSFDQNLGDLDISNVTNMSNMLDNTALSANNYDATLIGWSKQALQNNVVLGAQSLDYCNSTKHRKYIIKKYNWSFVGDVKSSSGCGGEDISYRGSTISKVDNNIFSTKNNIIIKHNAQNSSQVAVYNIKGQEIFHKEYNGTLDIQIPIKNSGIYIVHINNKDGVLRKKVLVE